MKHSIGEDLDVALLGDLVPSAFFLENFKDYEKEFLDIVSERGYPVDLWPSGDAVICPVVHMAKKTGRLPLTIPTNLPMVVDTYSGEKQDDRVVSDFKRDFSLASCASFVLTEGEEWWPYGPAFLAKDANSFMLRCLYLRARFNRDVLKVEKRRGRPRSSGDAVTSERSQRYAQWLQACAVYRERTAELAQILKTARHEYLEHKTKGAPLWIP